MRPAPHEQDLVFRLLQETSTLGEVAQFLQRKELPSSSGSWDHLIENRLEKPLKEGKLSREDLIDLLRLTEEHGKQHVFLYVCSRNVASDLLDRTRVTNTLKELRLERLFDAPRILDQPDSPTIVDVRFEQAQEGMFLVMKSVEQRVFRTFVDEKTEGNFIIRRYRDERVRAVNVARLGADGLLEIRIFSHVNASDYKNDVTAIWTRIESLFPSKEFKPLPITKAKNNLWNRRATLNDVLRYTDSRLRNSSGTVLSAATGSEEGSLFDDEGAERSIDEFLRHNAYCDASNIWWRKGTGEKPVIPSRDVHMILSGASNEFVLTAKTSKEDYEYALRQLRSHNK